MQKMTDEQIEAVLFDRSLLAECLDKSIGESDPAEDGREERERRLAELRSSLRKTA